MRKWIAGAAAVLIAIFLAISIGTRGDYAVARLATDKGRAIPDRGHDVIWDNITLPISLANSCA